MRRITTRASRWLAVGLCLAAAPAWADDDGWVHASKETAGPQLVIGEPDAIPAADISPAAQPRQGAVTLDEVFGLPPVQPVAEPAPLDRPGALDTVELIAPPDPNLDFTEINPGGSLRALTVSEVNGGLGEMPPPPEFYPGCTTCAPVVCRPLGPWYAGAEVLFLHRNGPDRTNVSIFDTNNAIALSTGQLSFEYSAMPRIWFGYDFDNGTRLEARYFGLNGWSGISSAASADSDIISFFNGGLDPSFDFGAFNTASFQSLDYDSHLHNVEFMLRRQIPRWVDLKPTLIAGVRYMNVNEKFEWLSFDSLAPVDVGQYRINTDNNIVALELGGEIGREIGDNFLLSAFGKTGLGMNFCEQNSSIISSGVLQADTGADDVQFASIIEVGLTGRYTVRRWLVITGGYQAFYVSGLALAAEQLDFSTNTLTSQRGINENGSIIMHGPSLGMELRW